MSGHFVDRLLLLSAVGAASFSAVIMLVGRRGGGDETKMRRDETAV